ADIPLLASPQGGVAERSGKYCEASADREARVVFRMNPMETTPAASASVASRNFFDYAATPPCGDARRGMAPHHNCKSSMTAGDVVAVLSAVREAQARQRAAPLCRRHRLDDRVHFVR